MTAATPGLAKTSIEWIRHERHRRFHAVYTRHPDGAYHTWCDRRVEEGAVRHTTHGEPAQKCSSCARRLDPARHYLISPQMKKLRALEE